VKRSVCVSGTFFRRFSMIASAATGGANQEKYVEAWSRHDATTLFWDAEKYATEDAGGPDGVPVAKDFANSAPCLALGKDIFQEERDQLASFLCFLLQQCTPELQY
jgi:hypothetical protein